MTEKRKLLGIIGGLGPASSAYFYELITEHTKASRDQDHIRGLPRSEFWSAGIESCKLMRLI